MERTDIFSIEVAKNIATNGRLFCVMMFVAAIAAYVKTGDASFLRLSCAFVLPVGAACVVDNFEWPSLRDVCMLVIYAWAFIFAVVFFFAIG